MAATTTPTTEQATHAGSATGSILERNLAALARSNPGLASRLRATDAHSKLTWIETPVGAYTATLDGRALASKRDPLAEARAWAEQVDLAKHAAVIVRGFALGYHLAALIERTAKHAAIFVFEPDLALMRAALERIDHSSWLDKWVVILTDAEDSGAIAAAMNPVEPLIAMGAQIADHAPSLPRLSAAGGGKFLEHATSVIAAVRLNVMTIFIQTEATLRNFLQNLDYYVTREGIEPLRNAFAGRPAITIASGPSLERNIELLSDPRVRERFVIIAAQTVLKPLLKRGIRPHFVTALDFHEVSKRFYEGLSAEDLKGITLVIEPKVNTAVPTAYHGHIRCTAAPFLDTLLGPEIARNMGEVPAGGTVAHLSCYLARFLGCDPIVLIGQDLGFTDGQYYPARAAIHEVWAGELNEFKTLEMMEWQRIKRHTPILRRATDHLGRSVYTDEQMHTYLVQFSRDFAADTAKGLRVIDATEGGVKKPSTEIQTLRETLDEWLDKPVTETVDAVLARHHAPMGERERRAVLRNVAERIRSVRHDTWRVGDLSRKAAGHLIEAREHHADQPRVNTLIGKLESLRDEVKAIQPAWPLVQMINQMGTFKRYRADRLIAINNDLTEMEKQRRQIDRDLSNVEWLADASDALAGLLDEAITTLTGGARLTRDPSPASLNALARKNPTLGANQERAVAHGVVAVIPLDLERSGLGIAHNPSLPIYEGRTALSLTLERLSRCRRLERIVVVCTDPAQAERIAQPLSRPEMVEFVRSEKPARAWPSEIASAGRLWAMHSWRGGLGDWTIYDEALNPAMAKDVVDSLAARSIDAALVVGSDWFLLDPQLTDLVIERYQENPDGHRIAFLHGGTALAGCVVARSMLADLSRGFEAGAFASIGGVLGYVPTMPIADMLAKSMCVTPPPGVRDGLVRCTADTPARAQWLIDALQSARLDPRTANAAEITAAIEQHHLRSGPIAPAHLTLRLCDGTKRLSEQAALARINAHAAARVDSTLTLLDERLEHPALFRLIRAAKEARIGAIHVRTRMTGTEAAADELMASHVHIVSVDIDKPDVFEGSLLRQLERQRANGFRGGGANTPWIVPRLVRRDAVYEQLESWYDRWLLAQGWAVIDAQHAPIAGERITPLPLPALALRRRAMEHVEIDADNREHRSEWKR